MQGQEIKVSGFARTCLKITALADTSLKAHSKCSFIPDKLRFFAHFCLVSPALATF